MKNYFTKFKKTIALVATIVLGAIAFMPSASALVDTPWGPARTTFTWEDPAPYATFNSITNNPQLGDERNFVRIREVADGSKFGDSVILEMGKTYEVYIYYHNNADGHEVGKTAIGIADGASVKSSFPATVKKGKKATVSATIFAADTDPLAVWDGAYMVPSRDLYLRYVPGSATIHNGGALNGQSIGPDYLFGDGALLGYNKFSGILPGCNEYAGYITYRIFADAPDFTVKKSIVGGVSTVKVGDEVTFKIRYDNTGTMNQSNVVVKDTLPAGLTYIPGSTVLYNNNLTSGKAVNDDIVSANGMNIGDYAGSTGWAEVVYKAKVSADVECDGKLELVNSAIVSTTDGNKKASVTITVEADKCEEKPEPEPDCTTNPELPECKKPDCTTNPELPECQQKPDCTTNPELPECQKPTCETNPEMEGCQTPEEIVSTGPLEITLAVVIVLGIAGGCFYLYHTKKTLKHVEDKVSGKTADKKVEETKKDDTLSKS
ncbi:DUF11 domain-containing protein [Candidatus Saccharibacteria bacterium]|nr:DUF11 domain-containing protein [Candidatus Saccharibacteria bacterium]